MQFPVQVAVNGIPIPLHFILESLAFIVGVRLYYFNKKKIVDPIADLDRLWIMLGAMIGALIGSRVLALLENPDTIFHQTWMSLYMNKTVAGGFLGGLFGVELTKKIIGVRIASGDIYVFPILVALIIGRIGCFSMGIAEPTYGIPTDWITGMDLGDGIRRHPVAVYEIVYLIGLIVFFQSTKNKNLPNGERFKWFMLLYFAYRFTVEFIKPFHALLIGLSSIQWAALFVFGYYYRCLYRIVTAYKKD